MSRMSYPFTSVTWDFLLHCFSKSISSSFLKISRENHQVTSYFDIIVKLCLHLNERSKMSLSCDSLGHLKGESGANLNLSPPVYR